MGTTLQKWYKQGLDLRYLAQLQQQFPKTGCGIGCLQVSWKVVFKKKKHLRTQFGNSHSEYVRAYQNLYIEKEAQMIWRYSQVWGCVSIDGPSRSRVFHRKHYNFKVLQV